MAAISICLLTYNNLPYIGQAIESVLNQTFTDWEMLISDDGSNDGTDQFVASFLNDPRIHYIRHSQNLGQARNWAYAIDHSSAPLITTLHADDIWRPDTLKRFITAFEGNSELDLVWGNWTRVTPDVRPIEHQPIANEPEDFAGPQIVRHLFEFNCLLPSASAVTRKVAEATGSPDSRYGMLCDREWWLRIAKNCRRARSLADNLMDYRVHDDSVSSRFNRDGRLIREVDLFDNELPRLLENVPRADQLIREYKLPMAEFHFRIAIRQSISGETMEARDRMRKALSYNPDLLRTGPHFVKWLLFQCGKLGRPLLRRLSRQNHLSMTAPKS